MVTFSCEEGWAPREQVSSPPHILDRFPRLWRAATAVLTARKGGNGGVFEAENTRNVALIERKNHKNDGFLVVVAELRPPVGARGGRQV
ncbi:hypothetical protein V6N13_017128 [Hibiscus sabdariffa]